MKLQARKKEITCKFEIASHFKLNLIVKGLGCVENLNVFRNNLIAAIKLSFNYCFS